MPGNPDKLDGWGAIELYLGVTRKTVLNRRYRLHRYATGVVYAYKSELDAQDIAEHWEKCRKDSPQLTCGVDMDSA